MMETIKSNKYTDISLLRDENDRYYVRCGEEELFSTKVLAAAETEYAYAVDSRDDKKSLREAERSFYTMQAVRSDSFARRASNARKTGGRGGRGGV